MPAWPSIWRNKTLETAGITNTPETLAILKAWHASTPLPPFSNNPIGMPAGSSGAPKYLNTKYAIFPSMTAFYKAFATFVASHAGKNLAQAMESEQAYSASWRVISDLRWPGHLTETDYPAKLLDLTSKKYQDSVNATDASERKTSGIVGKDPQTRNAIIAQSRSMHEVTQSIGHTAEAVQKLIRRHAKNG